MEISLKGKRALVCGGTQGIGKAIALELAAFGAEVLLMARNEEKLKSIVKELKADDGQKHGYIVADFSAPEKVSREVQHYLGKFKLPGVQILVNNAGGPAPGNILEAEPAQFKGAFDTHLINNHLLVQLLVPYMKEQKYGRIINIISTSVKEPIPGLGVSNTTRAAVAGWAKTLSSEVAGFGITVNNILPGYTKTERLNSLMEKKALAGNKTMKEVEAELLKDIPAGRFGEPEEQAALAVFLASPLAAYITGVNIQVDGGRIRSF
jgi:3-oxoacyl-[acyl-carrier protein] reductase